MRIIANPSCNLSDAAIQRYEIVVTPQHMIIDGEAHETIAPVPLAQVDRWVREAKEFPHMVGTTAQEFARIFHRVLHDDREILAIMTSKKVIQSYAAAVSAARAVQSSTQHQNAAIEIVDSTMTDAGAGLLTLVAGEAARAGIGLRKTVDVLDRLAARSRFVFLVESIEYLVKGGRASWLKGWLANLLNVKPVIAFVDGELKGIAKISGREDPVDFLVRDAVKSFGKQKVWVAVYHGGVPLKARALATELSRHLDVQYVYQRELSAGVYVYSGAGTLGYTILPVDDLPWTPTVPPDLSD